MSTYNFNITKNNDTDLKKDILSKMSEIREKYNSDEEYYNFFYDVVFVLNMIDINSSITLNINEDSTYTLTYLSNNESKTITGNLNIIKGVFDDLGDGLGDVLKITTDESPPTSVETPSVETPSVETSSVETSSVETPSVETSSVETSSVETSSVETPSVETSSVETSSVETLPDDSSSVSSNTPKKNNEKTGLFGLWGGNKNLESDFESDGSIISSDDESEDIVPYMTAVFDDDDDEEDLMDYVKNMKSKKYLKTLNNLDLRDILRKNNQVISKNNNYLSKKDMITSITQFYK